MVQDILDNTLKINQKKESLTDEPDLTKEEAEEATQILDNLINLSSQNCDESGEI